MKERAKNRPLLNTLYHCQHTRHSRSCMYPWNLPRIYVQYKYVLRVQLNLHGYCAVRPVFSGIYASGQ